MFWLLGYRLDYAATSAEQRFLDCDLPAVAGEREILEHLTRILEYRSRVKLRSFTPEASRNLQSAEMSRTHGLEHIVSSPPTLLPRFIFPSQNVLAATVRRGSMGGRIGSARRVIVKESSNSTETRGQHQTGRSMGKFDEVAGTTKIVGTVMQRSVTRLWTGSVVGISQILDEH
ncbi:hypothetical protein EDD17DRAFT_1000946 [Pisolithus thermaeus]|nr:hypothetical protein EDD17DRAFT_1000946 [Pisolithus thermaeus]